MNEEKIKELNRELEFVEKNISFYKEVRELKKNKTYNTIVENHIVEPLNNGLQVLLHIPENQLSQTRARLQVYQDLMEIFTPENETLDKKIEQLKKDKKVIEKIIKDGEKEQ